MLSIYTVTFILFCKKKLFCVYTIEVLQSLLLIKNPAENYLSKFINKNVVLLKNGHMLSLS